MFDNLHDLRHHNNSFNNFLLELRDFDHNLLNDWDDLRWAGFRDDYRFRFTYNLGNNIFQYCYNFLGNNNFFSLIDRYQFLLIPSHFNNFFFNSISNAVRLISGVLYCQFLNIFNSNIDFFRNNMFLLINWFNNFLKERFKIFNIDRNLVVMLCS